MSLFQHEKKVCEKRSGDLVLQVIDRGENRELRFGNYITQSAASRRTPDLLALDYTRAMMAGFLFCPDAGSVLHIGLGAGSMPRFIHRFFPDVQQTVVELYPEVTEVAFRFFGLPVSPRLRVVQADGAAYFQQSSERFDLIFLDAFHADGVAGHLETKTYFHAVSSHLEDRGWVVNNVWGSDRENLRRVAYNQSVVFPRLLSLSVRAYSNVIFFAGNAPHDPTPEQLRARAELLGARVPLDFGRYAVQVRTRAELSGELHP